MPQDLSLRLTHGYVGTYQHEDDWDTIGTIKELSTTVLPRSEADQNDICDPYTRQMLCIVTSTANDDAIRQALSDTYSKSGCHHEYDCCGCRSFSASMDKIARVTGDLWRIEIRSWRNY